MILFLACFAHGAAASAAGLEDTRYAVVLNERLVAEGVAGELPRSAVEGALNEALLSKGVTLIDAEQTRALRASLDPRAILDGKSLGPITTADADVVVVGVVLGSVTRPST
ncbi:MAG: hypothetical protein HC923_07530 [Myxococcales bacterium]|nr:hypothetical protein [Myxococcales bacterium]